MKYILLILILILICFSIKEDFMMLGISDKDYIYEPSGYKLPADMITDQYFER